MCCPPCKMIVLILCIGFLYIQPKMVSALGSRDITLGWGEGKLYFLRSSRILEAVSMQDLNIAPAPAPATTFRLANQSNKRSVKKGSDPIHNRS
ncbi:hypothetical protein RND71_026396 [Anisodus tanguticus]|uniref:Uncharacterized protein n=1 Tax=Anisodus tanguticus TaxID=243964 RepID=A0AAE1V3R7_9SOLA|nr:hypothetical protein RND71_026396 [Anisodus tanguticus]